MVVHRLTQPCHTRWIKKRNESTYNDDTILQKVASFVEFNDGTQTNANKLQ